MLPRAATGGGVELCPTIVVAAESFGLHCFSAAGAGGDGVESLELPGPPVDCCWGCDDEGKGNWNCVYVVWWLWVRTWVGRPWLKRIAGVGWSVVRPPPWRAWRVLAEVAVREN